MSNLTPGAPQVGQGQTMPPGPKPAELLVGGLLDDGWRVVEKLPRSPDSTGGKHSVPYVVERESDPTERAFLKALDFTVAFGMPAPLADCLRALTSAYIFERDLVMECAARRMSNVVVGITAGEVLIPASAVDPGYAILTSVPYIIFERADGDVRSKLATHGRSFDDAWTLRALHGIANGLRQLHSAGIDHQDVKPSNVMAFDDADVMKIGDLGRASPPGGGGLYDGFPIAGDHLYAPPELLYGELISDDRARRRAADMYQLGSMLVFLLRGAGLTALLEAKLDPAFHWRTWPRDYRNALPYIRDAFDQVVLETERTIGPAVRSAAIALIRELCDPDPLVRGNPRALGGAARYSVERHVSICDRLAKRAEIELRRVVA